MGLVEKHEMEGVKCHRPETLMEALEILGGSEGGQMTVFAGGTDLMIRKRNWQGARRRFDGDVVFIQQIESLGVIEVLEDELRIGATATQAQVLAHPQIPDYIKAVVGEMATPAIRQAATMGGNVVNAASVADTLPLLIAVDARVVLMGLEKGPGKAPGEARVITREMAVSDFILGKYKTALVSGELLVQLRIPKLGVQGFAYRKLGSRRASILSKLSVLVLWLAGGDIRVAIGAVNDTVVRDVGLEAAYKENGRNGAGEGEGARARALALVRGYGDLLNGADDKRSTKAYKEKVVLNLLREMLEVGK